jgi:hypothetical protein
MKHRGCITDPLARQWWREYQAICDQGNPLGLSFVEYVSARLLSVGPKTYTSVSAENSPYFVSTCGHRHEWGVTCNNVTVTQ